MPELHPVHASGALGFACRLELVDALYPLSDRRLVRGCVMWIRGAALSFGSPRLRAFERPRARTGPLPGNGITSPVDFRDPELSGFSVAVLGAIEAVRHRRAVPSRTSRSNTSSRMRR